MKKQTETPSYGRESNLEIRIQSFAHISPQIYINEALRCHSIMLLQGWNGNLSFWFATVWNFWIFNKSCVNNYLNVRTLLTLHHLFLVGLIYIFFLRNRSLVVLQLSIDIILLEAVFPKRKKYLWLTVIKLYKRKISYWDMYALPLSI